MTGVTIAHGEGRANGTGSSNQFGIATAVALTAGLLVVFLTAAWMGVPDDALVAGLVVVGMVVALATVVHGRVTEPLLVAVLVTGTFAVKISLTGGPYPAPGSLGTWFWLVDAALLVAVPLGTLRGWFRPTEFTAPAILFGFAVVWALVTTVFGPTPRPDVAFLYALYLLRGWLVFVLVAAAVRTGPLTLLTVAGSVIAAATGHALVGVVQSLSGDSLGVRTIAAGSTRQIGVLSVSSVSIPVGPYVSGFTAAGSLSGLLALGFPLALAGALFGRTRRIQIVAAVAAIVMASTLRFTDWDSARGALVLEIVILTVYAVSRVDLDLLRSLRVVTDRKNTTLARLPAYIAPGVVVAAAASVLLYPSSTSGQPLDPAVVGPSPLADISIPLFSLSALGVRIEQYAAGLRVFAGNPLLGVGGANFPFVAAAYGLPNGLLMHNVFVGFLAETGLPGFLLGTAALVGVVDAGRWLLQADRYPIVAVGALAAIAGYLAVLFWQPQWLRITSFLPFWGLAGGLVGSASAANSDDSLTDGRGLS